MYLYIKALHIIFIVTWFAGLFYMPRLLIYNTEAAEQPAPIQDALRKQFTVMIKRLWWGITWPSAILTLIFGGTTWYLMGNLPTWLFIKLFFVAGLYGYHFTLHSLVKQQVLGKFRFSSQQLRIWNEIATVFLVAIVMLAVVKQALSFVWGLAGLILFIMLLMSAVKIYKLLRNKQ
ncbi:MAG: CopD family protein [Chitinophagaceae bacterium]